MDFSDIQTHLDNFVDTWTGWGKVVTGLLGDPETGQGGAINNFFLAWSYLSTEPSSSDIFVNTSSDN